MLHKNLWIEELEQDKVESWITKNGEAAMRNHRTSNPYFALWLSVLDRLCQRKIWMSYQDLEDWDYASAYEADIAPKEALEEMLMENGYDYADGEW